MRYNTLAFTIHKKCNAECSMCCFKSNPRCQETLDRERIIDLIEQSKEIEEITTISFTGGEPFLTLNDLTKLINASKQAGKRVTTISNGFWGTSYEKAYNVLKKLKEVGLDHLNLSHDAYHKEYVKTEYVKNVLNAATRLGIQTTLAMVVIKNERVGSIIDELGDGIYGSELTVIPCLPSGGAIETFQEHEFDRTLDSKKLKCIYDGNILVSYSGKIYPCCSQMILNTGLSVGNYEDMNLKEVLYNLKNNSLLYLLRNESMAFFIDIARNKLNMDIPDKVVNICELCPMLFNEDNISKFKPYIIEKINIDYS